MDWRVPLQVHRRAVPCHFGGAARAWRGVFGLLRRGSVRWYIFELLYATERLNKDIHIFEFEVLSDAGLDVTTVARRFDRGSETGGTPSEKPGLYVKLASPRIG